MLQRITEGEGSLAGEEEGGKNRSERKPGRPKTSKGREEAKGTSRAPLGRAEKGSPSSQKTKIVGKKQEEEPTRQSGGEAESRRIQLTTGSQGEEPTREDPQAQGQPATKET